MNADKFFVAVVNSALRWASFAAGCALAGCLAAMTGCGCEAKAADPAPAKAKACPCGPTCKCAPACQCGEACGRAGPKAGLLARLKAAAAPEASAAYAAVYARVLKGETLYVFAGWAVPRTLDPATGELAPVPKGWVKIDSDDWPAGRGIWKCELVNGKPKMLEVTFGAARAVPRPTFRHAGHDCPACGRHQFVVAGWNRDGTHTHRCPRCGAAWSH